MSLAVYSWLKLCNSLSIFVAAWWSDIISSKSLPHLLQ